MSILERNNVQISGSGQRAMVFSHGFGCDQRVWRHVAPSFGRDFRTVLIDHVGCGASQLPSYSTDRYATIAQYSSDLVQVGRTLALTHAVLVGHSFGAMVAALASIEAPEMFDELILISPNARHIDDGSYIGGFSLTQAESMLRLVDQDYVQWSSRMAPILMDDPDKPEHAVELEANLHRQDSHVAKDLARVVLRADVRDALSRVKARTIVVSGRGHLMAPEVASAHVSHRIGCTSVDIQARGYLPQVSAPLETVMAMTAFLRDGKRATAIRRVVKLRDFVREGSKVLGIAAGSGAGQGHTNPERLDQLLSRTGELWMHIGRYDMYALSLQRLLTPGGVVDTDAFNVCSRGTEISRRLSTLSKDLALHFSETDLEVQSILRTSLPSAQHGAVIGGLLSLQLQDQDTTQRSWFDQVNASEEDWDREADRVERHILRMVALCFRICQCALQTQRLLHYEDTLQNRALWPKADD